MKVRRFVEKLESIHETFVNAKRTSRSLTYSFDEMVEVMWMLKIYPFLASKKRLRFYYLYSQAAANALTLPQIAMVYVYLALARDLDWDQSIREVVAKVVDFSRTEKAH